jgi:psp operon transcriptional activator
VRVDVRIVGATHADLPRLAAEGRFMRDLLDRLSFEVLFVPPLRERGDDVELLANHFAARMAHELGRDAPPVFAPEALAALETYAWPGNVRELKNVVERAVCRAEGDEIAEIVFDPFARTDARADRGERTRGDASRPVPGPDNRAGTVIRDEESPSAPRPDSRPSDAPGAAGTSAAADAMEAGPGAADASAETGAEAGAGAYRFGTPLKEQVRRLEVAALRAALSASGGRQRAAAERLGLTYHQFRGLYRKHADALSRRAQRREQPGGPAP